MKAWSLRTERKKSLIQLNKCANQLTYLALAKQRYHCRGCHTYFTANTYIVDRNCFIAKQVRYKILEELTEKQAMTTIAKHCGVSWSTVSRTLASLIPMTKVKKKLVTALFINGWISFTEKSSRSLLLFLYGWRYWKITGYSSFTEEKRLSFLILCNLNDAHDWR